MAAFKTRDLFSRLRVSGLIAVLVGVILLLIADKDTSWDTFSHQLEHEIGFALIVAVVIWATFEYFSDARSEQHWNDRIERITKSVFFGVFKRNFPEQLIKEANLLLLEQNFIRSGLHVTYVLEDATFKDRVGTDRDFVKLNAITRFTVENVGNATSSLPLGIGLPNPMINEMKEFCKVKSISTRPTNLHPFVSIDLNQAAVAFGSEIMNDNLHTVNFSVSPIILNPGDKLEVKIEYTMAKESEDTEIFQTRYPSDSMLITVVDRSVMPKVIRARAIHPQPLENDSSAETVGTYNFKINRYLLPHQGYAIWWKKLPASPPGPTPAVKIETGPLTG